MFIDFLGKVSPDFERTEEFNRTMDFVFNGLILGNSPKRNFILHGPVGSGKSITLKLIAHFLQKLTIIQKPVFIESYRLVQEFRAMTEPEREPLLRRYANTKFLFLDDLGAEPELVIFGAKRNIIQELMFMRYDNYHSGRRTYMTTNLSLQGIKQTYGERIFSRLIETCEWDATSLTTDDRRLTGKTAAIHYNLLPDMKLQNQLAI